MPSTQSFDVPVLLLTYRRPRTTSRVIAALREIKPSRVFFAADAPNPSNPGEAELCAQVRELADTIDWPCEVTRRFRKENEGLRKAVNSSVDWFFENVESGIILEDDCVPGIDFFRFCKGLLEKYEDAPRIAQISGNNHDTRHVTQNSFRFSRYPHIWGWATWADRWKAARATEFSRETLKGQLKKHFSDENERTFWLLLFDCVERGKIDTWDFSWLFAMQINDQLSITPSRNLVENIGFGEGATHTTSNEALHANRPAETMEFPLRIPDTIEVDADRDREVARHLYRIDQSARRGHANLRLTKWIPKPLKDRLKRMIR